MWLGGSWWLEREGYTWLSSQVCEAVQVLHSARLPSFRGHNAIIKLRNCFLTRKFWCQNSSVHLRIRIITPRGRNHASHGLLGPCTFGSILVRINRVSLDVQPRPKRFQMSVGESSKRQESKRIYDPWPEDLE